MNCDKLVDEYINYRMALGSKMTTQCATLRHFCKYLRLNSPGLIIDNDIVYKFLYDGDEITSNLFVKYYALKGFFTWCLQRDFISEMPLPKRLPKRIRTFRPYIYSDNELKAIFTNARNYKDRSNGTIYPECVRVILMLTYFLGLRISETLALEIQDINLDECYLRIKCTKFYKERLVTYNETVRTLIIDFLNWRIKKGMPNSQDASLWLDRNLKPMKLRAMRYTFDKIRKMSGIRRIDMKQQPRIHDLRHTFAVNRLNQWYERGKDVQKLLPILSTYMGHIGISETSLYLTITDSIMKHASDLFESYSNEE